MHSDKGRANATFESLELKGILLHDDNAALWHRAFSYLQTNKALKSLEIEVLHGVEESYFSAFRIEITAMLQENTSLERLLIQNIYGWIEAIEVEEHVALVTSSNTIRLSRFAVYLTILIGFG
jgi:hypothetical protein